MAIGPKNESGAWGGVWKQQSPLWLIKLSENKTWPTGRNSISRRILHVWLYFKNLIYTHIISYKDTVQIISLSDDWSTDLLYIYFFIWSRWILTFQLVSSHLGQSPVNCLHSQAIFPPNWNIFVEHCNLQDWYIYASVPLKQPKK